MIRKLKILRTFTALVLVSAIFAQSASAEGNVERGAILGYTCLGCHGIEGYRNAYPSYRVPKLGGQKASYLVVALQGYRDGTRPHPTMISQAASLSDQEIEDEICYIVEAEENDGGSRGDKGFSRSNVGCITIVPEILMANAIIPNAPYPNNEIMPVLTFIPRQYIYAVYLITKR